MRFRSPLPPSDQEIRWVKKFAFLPEWIEEGLTVWMESYREQQRYNTQTMRWHTISRELIYEERHDR